MSRPEALWAINNEYRRRLGALKAHISLLEQLLTSRSRAEPAFRASIRHICTSLDRIESDHSAWRHHYYYHQVADDRRMVDDPQAVLTALKTFSAMFSRHLRQFDAMAAAMIDLAPPDPTLTRVVRGGDLWQMCLQDIHALASYDHVVHDLLAGQPQKRPA